jgi:hypothetical protein
MLYPTRLEGPRRHVLQRVRRGLRVLEAPRSCAGDLMAVQRNVRGRLETFYSGLCQASVQSSRS